MRIIKVHQRSSSYRLIEDEFLCQHANVNFYRDDAPFAPYGVQCLDCDNEDMTDKQAQFMIDNHDWGLNGS